MTTHRGDKRADELARQLRAILPCKGPTAAKRISPWLVRVYDGARNVGTDPVTALADFLQRDAYPKRWPELLRNNDVQGPERRREAASVVAVIESAPASSAPPRRAARGGETAE